ncbi:hypothetical protein [Pelagicoccus albus]|uniref:Alkaline shock response membrane anchor protein AmaP n=1 Tax=Pelagicoccus albus TaxID=415222 RepID=A0A7X1E8J5_9BACT|nr:hypothetical protein [Pelagicoccus albus]MBC2606336.1 hypothetical protein [Pelagicoccus albus]
MDSLESAKDFLSNLGPLPIVAGLAVLVFLLIGLRLVFKKPPSHLTAFSGDTGSVMVSRKALQELIKSACMLEEWVEAARPVIKVKDNQLTARVELRLASPENLKAVCERVQDHITTLLHKSLSFDQIGNIQIVVKSFGNNESEEGPNQEHLRTESEISPSAPATENTASPEEAAETKKETEN